MNPACIVARVVLGEVVKEADDKATSTRTKENKGKFAIKYRNKSSNGDYIKIPMQGRAVWLMYDDLQPPPELVQIAEATEARRNRIKKAAEPAVPPSDGDADMQTAHAVHSDDSSATDGDAATAAAATARDQSPAQPRSRSRSRSRSSSRSRKATGNDVVAKETQRRSTRQSARLERHISGTACVGDDPRDYKCCICNHDGSSLTLYTCTCGKFWHRVCALHTEGRNCGKCEAVIVGATMSSLPVERSSPSSPAPPQPEFEPLECDEFSDDAAGAKEAQPEFEPPGIENFSDATAAAAAAEEEEAHSSASEEGADDDATADDDGNHRRRSRRSTARNQPQSPAAQPRSHNRSRSHSHSRDSSSTEEEAESWRLRTALRHDPTAAGGRPPFSDEERASGSDAQSDLANSECSDDVQESVGNSTVNTAPSTVSISSTQHQASTYGGQSDESTIASSLASVDDSKWQRCTCTGLYQLGSDTYRCDLYAFYKLPIMDRGLIKLQAGVRHCARCNAIKTHARIKLDDCEDHCIRVAVKDAVDGACWGEWPLRINPEMVDNGPSQEVDGGLAMFCRAKVPAGIALPYHGEEQICRFQCERMTAWGYSKWFQAVGTGLIGTTVLNGQYIKEPGMQHCNTAIKGLNLAVDSSSCNCRHMQADSNSIRVLRDLGPNDELIMQYGNTKAANELAFAAGVDVEEVARRLGLKPVLLCTMDGLEMRHERSKMCAEYYNDTSLEQLRRLACQRNGTYFYQFARFDDPTEYTGTDEGDKYVKPGSMVWFQPNSSSVPSSVPTSTDEAEDAFRHRRRPMARSQPMAMASPVHSASRTHVSATSLLKAASPKSASPKSASPKSSPKSPILHWGAFQQSYDTALPLDDQYMHPDEQLPARNRPAKCEGRGPTCGKGKGKGDKCDCPRNIAVARMDPRVVDACSAFATVEDLPGVKSAGYNEYKDPRGPEMLSKALISATNRLLAVLRSFHTASASGATKEDDREKNRRSVEVWGAEQIGAFRASIRNTFVAMFEELHTGREESPQDASHGEHNEFFMIFKSVARRVLTSKDILKVGLDLLGAPENPFNNSDATPFAERSRASRGALKGYTSSMVNNTMLHILHTATGILTPPDDTEMDQYCASVAEFMQELVKRVGRMVPTIRYLQTRQTLIQSLRMHNDVEAAMQLRHTSTVNAARQRRSLAHNHPLSADLADQRPMLLASQVPVVLDGEVVDRGVAARVSEVKSCVNVISTSGEGHERGVCSEGACVPLLGPRGVMDRYTNIEVVPGDVRRGITSALRWAFWDNNRAIGHAYHRRLVCVRGFERGALDLNQDRFPGESYLRHLVGSVGSVGGSVDWDATAHENRFGGSSLFALNGNPEDLARQELDKFNDYTLWNAGGGPACLHVVFSNVDDARDFADSQGECAGLVREWAVIGTADAANLAMAEQDISLLAIAPAHHALCNTPKAMHLLGCWNGKEHRINMGVHARLFGAEVRVTESGAIFVDTVTGTLVQFVMPWAGDGACFRFALATRSPGSNDGCMVEDTARLPTLCRIFSKAEPRPQRTTVDADGTVTLLGTALGAAINEVVECSDKTVTNFTMMVELHGLLAASDIIASEKSSSQSAAWTVLNNVKPLLLQNAQRPSQGVGSEYLLKIRIHILTSLPQVRKATVIQWLNSLRTSIAALKRYEEGLYGCDLTASAMCKSTVQRILDVVWGGCPGTHQCSKLPHGHMLKCPCSGHEDGNSCRLTVAFDGNSEEFTLAERGVLRRALDNELLDVKEALCNNSTIHWYDGHLKSYLHVDPEALNAALWRVLKRVGACVQDDFSDFTCMEAVGVFITEQLDANLKGLIATRCTTLEKGKASLLRVAKGCVGAAITLAKSSPDPLHLGLNATKRCAKSTCDMTIAVTGGVDCLRKPWKAIYDVDRLDHDWIGGGNGPKGKRLRKQALPLGGSLRSAGWTVLADLEETKYVCLDALTAIMTIPDDLKREYVDACGPDTGVEDFLHVAISQHLMQQKQHRYIANSDRVDRWRYAARLAMAATVPSDASLVSTYQLTCTLPNIHSRYGEEGCSTNLGDCNKIEHLVKAMKVHYKSLDNTRLDKMDKSQQLLFNEVAAFLHEHREWDAECPTLANKIAGLVRGHLEKLEELEQEADDWREGGLFQQADTLSDRAVLGFRFAWADAVKRRIATIRRVQRSASTESTSNGEPPLFDEVAHAIADANALLTEPAPWLTACDSIRDGVITLSSANITARGGVLQQLIDGADAEIRAVRSSTKYTQAVEQLFCGKTGAATAYANGESGTTTQSTSFTKLSQSLSRALKRNRLSPRSDHAYSQTLMALGDDFFSLRPIEMMYRRARLVTDAESQDCNIIMGKQPPESESVEAEAPACFCPLVLPDLLTRHVGGEQLATVFWATVDAPRDESCYSVGVLVSSNILPDNKRVYDVRSLEIAKAQRSSSRRGNRSWATTLDSANPEIVGGFVQESIFADDTVFLLSRNGPVLSVGQDSVIYGPTESFTVWCVVYEPPRGYPEPGNGQCYVKQYRHDRREAQLAIPDYQEYIRDRSDRLSAMVTTTPPSTASVSQTTTPTQQEGSVANLLVQLAQSETQSEQEAQSELESQSEAQSEPEQAQSDQDPKLERPMGLCNSNTVGQKDFLLCWLNAVFQGIEAVLVHEGYQLKPVVGESQQHSVYNEVVTLLERQVLVDARQLSIALKNAGLQHDPARNDDDSAAGCCKLLECLGHVDQRIKRLFASVAVSSVRCNKCNNETQTRADFLILPLPSTNTETLDTALSLWLTPEDIHSYDCTRCPRRVRRRPTATLQWQFEALPHCLCVDLTASTPWQQGVQFEETLQLLGVSFVLVAVVWRLGTEYSSGHYIATVRYSRNVVTGGVSWFNVDDEVVLPAAPSLPPARNARAKILFYIRAQPLESAQAHGGRGRGGAGKRRQRSPHASPSPAPRKRSGGSGGRGRGGAGKQTHASPAPRKQSGGRGRGGAGKRTHRSPSSSPAPRKRTNTDTETQRLTAIMAGACTDEAIGVDQLFRITGASSDFKNLRRARFNELFAALCASGAVVEVEPIQTPVKHRKSRQKQHFRSVRQFRPASMSKRVAANDGAAESMELAQSGRLKRLQRSPASAAAEGNKKPSKRQIAASQALTEVTAIMTNEPVTTSPELRTAMAAAESAAQGILGRRSASASKISWKPGKRQIPGGIETTESPPLSRHRPRMAGLATSGDESVARPAQPAQPDWISTFRVRPHGVLDRLPSNSIEQRPQSVVIVDPAGLKYIQDGPTGAGGASQAIYRWLSTKRRPFQFPKRVKRNVKAVGDACYNWYRVGNVLKHVIHVVGPNFGAGGKTSQAHAIQALTQIYVNVLEAFVTECAGFVNPVLRLVPVSSGNFAGQLRSRMPTITMEALFQAFARVSPPLQSVAVHLCLYGGDGVEDYKSAGKACIMRQLKDCCGLTETSVQAFNGSCGPEALNQAALSAGIGVRGLTIIDWRSIVQAEGVRMAQEHSDFVASTKGNWEGADLYDGSVKCAPFTWSEWKCMVVNTSFWFRTFEMTLVAAWLDRCHPGCRLIVVDPMSDHGSCVVRRPFEQMGNESGDDARITKARWKCEPVALPPHAIKPTDVCVLNTWNNTHWVGLVRITGP
jgi:hypothetical protein